MLIALVTRLRPFGRLVRQRLRLHGWSWVVGGLSLVGLVVIVVLGALAPVLYSPVGRAIRPAAARLVGRYADLHRWIVGSTLQDEHPHGYGSAPFNPAGLLRVPSTHGRDLRSDLRWLIVNVPTGIGVTLLGGVLPVVSLNAISQPLQFAVIGSGPSTSMVASSWTMAVLVMAVGVLGLILWAWHAPRIVRRYAVLSRRLLGEAATTAVTARVVQLLSAPANTPAAGTGKLARLTPRELEVLALVAQGRTNAAIATRLFITEKAVDKHLTSVFRKLDLTMSAADNRRVLAALAYRAE